MNKDSKIFVAGGIGLVGSAIIRNLINRGYQNIVASYRNRKPSSDMLAGDKTRFVRLDMMDKNAVNSFFKHEKPEFVYLAAAKVGGIVANSKYRADFIYENLQIQNNTIYAAYKNDLGRVF
ncbi:GDP-L-fucose synthase 1 [Denitrovibrio acetiphilus DSM 12809]|uniref:GDP-L-fucose synthase 1 n=1 Tax=Denitrovibrio acetiphilus (strain DSM 12809 / NBRC 114555 / N2460) TaxID=522772 RepID=D4H5U7_DENA2|nr:NAD-dependent epimerase/dehydratase family protein [Denitrovibrio acetiphilus]ADD69538.1 GDP-L-fucose synthase 1 [Denitrovibrio acetiphilus DSM 12809]